MGRNVNYPCLEEATVTALCGALFDRAFYIRDVIVAVKGVDIELSHGITYLIQLLPLTSI